MTDRPETFEQWRDRTSVAQTSVRFVKVGSFLAVCLFVAEVTGFWPLWLLALPALVAWTVIDWRRSRRRRLGRER